MRVRVMLSVALSLCMTVCATAHATDIYADAIAKYVHAKYGTPESEELKLVRVIGYSSVAIPCPKRSACKRPGRAFLVGYSVGDGGGQALEFRKTDAPCTDCITSVAVAGGGVLDRRDVMSYGLTAAQAKALVPHDP